MNKYLFGAIMSFFLLGILVCMSNFFSLEANTIQDSKAAVIFFENELNFTATPGTVKKAVQGKISGVIVDVRRKEHFEKSHIPGAINIPFDEYDSFSGEPVDSEEARFPELSKDTMNYIYCYELLCSLSQKAAKKFATLGYPVKEMKGGFKAWTEHDYPTEK